MTTDNSNIEVNYYPVDSQPTTPLVTNTPVVPPSGTNIIPTANGTSLNQGSIQSSNFVTGSGGSGWKLDAGGTIEATSGKFRGDITGASGTFSGTITASAGSIGGFGIGPDYIRDAANSFGLTSTVTGGNDARFWAGDTFVNRATAPLRMYEDGSIVASNINATGAIQATSGWIGAATALVYEAQGINTGTTGWIRGGQTGYNTGTGYFLGYSSGVYKFSIGDTTTSNSLLWDGSTLIVNGSTFTNNDVYGDGSDGDVTISGDTTLTSDMFYNNLIINTTKTLNPNGFRIFVKGTLTYNGTGKIASNGGSGGNGGNGAATPTYLGGAAGSAGTIANTVGSLPASFAGKAGGGGPNGSGGPSCGGAGNAGGNGDNAVKALSGAGSAGGAGGNDTLGDCGGAGAAGSAGTVSGTIFNIIHNALSAYFLMDFLPSETMFSIASGSGGGGSGGSARNDGAGGGGGGGSGATGGIVWVAARKIVTVNNNDYIQATGGNGGNGGNGATGVTNSSGGGGGGAGGRGGIVILIYSLLSGLGTINVSGGTKGVKGTVTGASNGSDGNDGGSGNVIYLQV